MVIDIKFFIVETKNKKLRLFVVPVFGGALWQL